MPHVAMRPLWRCRACGAHWPCQPARLALLVEYRHDRPALLIYLGTLMAEASAQLAQLNGNAPPAGLHERFLAWARVRDGRMST
ncbi:flavin reductase [Micromonospora sp. HSS6-12]|uniref:Flavin reductase n=1 Tax=Micromonospora thermarum TaxID=2720024 RepID=A0ABX0YZB6_9ACTN|nr:flavin reductase [Micromonospora thermarum]